MSIDGVTQAWHYRFFDLSVFAGKMLHYAEYVTGAETTATLWTVYYHDVALVQASGNVLSFYNGQKSVTLTAGSVGGGSNSYAVDHLSGNGLSVLTTQYYHGDHLGSSRLMTAYEGYPVWSATYLPFGQEHAPQPSTNHYKFTGHERDPESSLDYMKARYYSSAFGRFTSPDPYMGSARRTNPQSWNRYSYVLNNPLNYVDPDGLDPCPNSDSDGCTVERRDSRGGHFDHENQTYTFTRVETTIVRNEKGDIVQQSVTTTSATISLSEGSEGQFLGGRQSTQTTTANANGSGFARSDVQTRELTQGQTREALGYYHDLNGRRAGFELDRLWKAFQPRREGLGLPGAFAVEVGRELRDRPFQMAGRAVAAGALAACLYVPGCAVGASGWLTAVGGVAVGGLSLADEIQQANRPK